VNLQYWAVQYRRLRNPNLVPQGLIAHTAVSEQTGLLRALLSFVVRPSRRSFLHAKDRSKFHVDKNNKNNNIAPNKVTTAALQ